jgi:hypothetical protein
VTSYFTKSTSFTHESAIFGFLERGPGLVVPLAILTKSIAHSILQVREFVEEVRAVGLRGVLMRL